MAGEWRAVLQTPQGCGKHHEALIESGGVIPKSYVPGVRHDVSLSDGGFVLTGSGRLDDGILGVVGDQYRLADSRQSLIAPPQNEVSDPFGRLANIPLCRCKEDRP